MYIHRQEKYYFTKQKNEYVRIFNNTELANIRCTIISNSRRVYLASLATSHVTYTNLTPLARAASVCAQMAQLT